MKTSKFTETQIVSILKQADAGKKGSGWTAPHSTDR
jgi:hypothetical protein